MKRRVCRLRANAIIVVALLLCIAASWAVASAMVQRARHAAETRAFAEARGLSRLLAAEWSRTIVQIGSLEKIAAIVTRASLAGESPDAAMHELRLAMSQVGPDIAQVAAIAPNGYILWSNLPLPAAPVDLSEREHFRAIAIDGQDFFTGSPVLGKVSGQRTVQMSAAVRDNNGALQAVVVVSVDAAMLGRIAQTLGAEHHSIFALVRRDRRLLMRSEPLPPNQTDDATISDVDEAFTHGSLERLHRSPQDGVRRFFALKAVPGTDTLVAAGVDEADIMQATVAAVVGIWQQTAMLSVVLIIAALAISFGVQRTKTLNAERARNAAVAESEALMRQFSDRATDMIGLLDEGFNYIYANAALCRMLATTPEQLLGTRAGGHVVAEHKHRVISTINALIDGLDSVRVDYQVHHGNGSIVWIETELVLFRAENATRATNLRYIAISRDVTERKVAEASLIEAHENLDALLRESQVLLFRDQYRLDAPKRLRLVGAKEATIWGWPTADVERQGFLPSHLDAASSQAFLDMRRDCARNGHAVAELRFKAANGDWRWMRIHCIRIEQSADTAELLHLASDVTIEFESRQFREQTERLAVIGEVCAGIAHEVNQPLAVIAMAAANGLMELERFPDVSQRVAAKFQRIEKQALRVEKIISHIRNFGRKDLAKSESFSAAELIEDALVLGQARMTASDVVPYVEIAANISQITGTRAVLEQVLMNLIVNACDAYDDNQPTRSAFLSRSIHIAVAEHNGGHAIRIADQAGGIPPQVIDKIFTPFFTTKEAGKGTGLGLSFCAKSVAEMGGVISVSSENGGTVFEVRLPHLPDLPNEADVIESVDVQ